MGQSTLVAYRQNVRAAQLSRKQSSICSAFCCAEFQCQFHNCLLKYWRTCQPPQYAKPWLKKQVDTVTFFEILDFYLVTQI